LKPVVFFDIDGVLADFVRGSFRRHGVSLPIAVVRWDFDQQLGIEPAAFWGAFDREFWATLDPMPDGFALLRAAERMLPAEQVGLLTSAAGQPGCVDGKRDWVARHLPDYLPRMFTGTAKHLVAGPGKVLVDDRTENADGFFTAGGKSLLVPRPWNGRGYLCDREGGFDVAAAVDDLRGELCRATRY
jgi:hypothetical protein